MLITEGLKSQESFFQDVETWLGFLFTAQTQKSKVDEKLNSESRNLARTDPYGSQCPKPLFYPAWEILPHEGKLSHVDVISERLQTLAALSEASQSSDSSSPIIITNVVALMQRTFTAEALRGRSRKLARGDRIDPLDLIEWLEGQGYEPEAQVTQKGEIALRGGILDLFPLTNPWPVRLEFFGDELESLRQFDPITQVSREEIDGLSIPPAGELGILKQSREKEAPALRRRLPRCIEFRAA